MLVLSRKKNESIVINNDITVVVVEIRGDKVRLGVEAPFDLTTAQTARFNADVPDHPRVRYFSIVGTIPAGGDGMPAILRPVCRYLDRQGAPHDGLVPAESQRWGKVLWELEASHFAQIGWSEAFDANKLMQKLALRLRQQGL